MEDIPAFFETLQRGIYTSQLRKNAEQGMETSGCVTLIVPRGEKDGSCNLIVDRDIVMEAIHKFQLSRLFNLE
jgi:hypothetical protein